MPQTHTRAIQKLTAWYQNLALDLRCQQYFDVQHATLAMASTIHEHFQPTQSAVIWLSLPADKLVDILPYDHLEVPSHKALVFASLYIDPSHDLNLSLSRLWPAPHILFNEEVASHNNTQLSLNSINKLVQRSDQVQGHPVSQFCQALISVIRQQFPKINAQFFNFHLQTEVDILALNHQFENEQLKLQAYQDLIMNAGSEQNNTWPDMLHAPITESPYALSTQLSKLDWILNLQLGESLMATLASAKKHSLACVSHKEGDAIKNAIFAQSIDTYIEEFKHISQSQMQFSTVDSFVWQHKPLTIYHRIGALSCPAILTIIEENAAPNFDAQLEQQHVERLPSYIVQTKNDLIAFLDELTSSEKSLAQWLKLGVKLPSVDLAINKKGHLLSSAYKQSEKIREYLQIQEDQRELPSKIDQLQVKVDQFATLAIEKQHNISTLQARIQKLKHIEESWLDKVEAATDTSQILFKISQLFARKQAKKRLLQLEESMQSRMIKLQNRINKLQFKLHGAKAAFEAMKSEHANFQTELETTLFLYNESNAKKAAFLSQFGNNFRFKDAYQATAEQIQSSSFNTRLNKLDAVIYRTTVFESLSQLVQNLKVLSTSLQYPALFNALSTEQHTQLFKALCAVCPNIKISESLYFQFFKAVSPECFQSIFVETENTMLRLLPFTVEKLPVIAAPTHVPAHTCMITNSVYTTPVHPLSKPVASQTHTRKVTSFA